jgi:hypothetical protein
MILSAVFGGAELAISSARWDLGHEQRCEANPKNPKSMNDKGVSGFGAPGWI